MNDQNHAGTHSLRRVEGRRGSDVAKGRKWDLEGGLSRVTERGTRRSPLRRGALLSTLSLSPRTLPSRCLGPAQRRTTTCNLARTHRRQATPLVSATDGRGDAPNTVRICSHQRFVLAAARQALPSHPPPARQILPIPIHEKVTCSSEQLRLVLALSFWHSAKSCSPPSNHPALLGQDRKERLVANLAASSAQRTLPSDGPPRCRTSVRL